LVNTILTSKGTGSVTATAGMRLWGRTEPRKGSWDRGGRSII